MVETHVSDARKPAADRLRARSTAEEIIRSFNTWAFKREQPSDGKLLQRSIAEAVALRHPVTFVLYWGKGPRRFVSQPEIQCLDYLAALQERIKSTYAPGAKIILLLTDTHARLNGYSQTDIDAYFSSVGAATKAYEYQCRRLSDVCLAGQHDTGLEVSSPPDPELLERLTRSASKWYRGGDAPEDAAVRYYAMNMVERQAVEHCYPEAVFVTFNSSLFRALFPHQLPIFYMYSIKKGVAEKPWFIPVDLECATTAAAAE